MSVSATTPNPTAAPTSAAKTNRRAFVPEIQGLRAIAVAAVVIYHLTPAWLPGGFTGVDAFFVVSGFLITGHLLHELRTNGRIRLPRFWAGRFRRLWPAQAVTITTTAIAATLLLPRAEALATLRGGFASVFYAQNWYLAAQSTNYLNNDAPPSPFQHFWSLAIEEQFYFAWPLALLSAVLIAQGLRRQLNLAPMTPRTKTTAALVSVAGITALSFSICLWLVHTGGPEIYFGTHTRGWQLGIGGLLAFVPHAVRFSPRSSRLLALLGLTTLVAGFRWIDGGAQYPDLSASIPVLGTAAIILASTHGAPGLQILRNRAARAIGDRSYAIYLVHWPIIALLAAATPWGRPTQIAVAVLGSILAASAMFRWVEQPGRQHPRLQTPKTVFVFTTATMTGTAILLITLTTIVAAKATPPTTAPFPLGHGSPYGAPALATNATFITADTSIYPDPDTAAKTDQALADTPHCQTEPADPTPVTCVFGPNDATTTIALVGDSHATQWLPALQVIAEERNWRIKTYLHSSCAFSKVPRNYNAAQEDACRTSNTKRAALIANDPEIDVVLTSALAGDGFAGEDKDPEVGVTGFTEAWQELQAAGKDVVVLRDNPQSRKSAQVTTCVRQHRKHPETCALQLKEALPRDRQLAAAQKLPTVDVVDLTNKFCRGQECPAVIGNVLVYRDNNHLTASYVQSLAPDLDSELSQLCSRVDALCGA